MLGFVSFFSSACSVALQLVSGMIADALGWRAMFGLFAASLLLVPAAWGALPRGRAARHVVAGGWGEVGRLWPLFALLCVYTILIYMTALQSPFLLSSRGVASATEIGALLALTSVFGGIGSFAYGFMRRYMGFAAMIAFASLTGGAGMVLAGVAAPIAAYLPAAILIGMGIGIIEPTIASEALRRTPERLHDRAMGVNIAAMFLGQFLNPLVMGPLRVNWGIAAAFAIVGAGFVAAGVLFLASALRRDPRALPA